MSDITRPVLFQPLKINDSIELPNRIGVSPMCMYAASTSTNEISSFHLIHYGSFAIRGPGIIFIESTSVSKNSGLSNYDLGLWNDYQAENLKKIVDFIHEQKNSIYCCIQLNHGGRKIGEGKGFGIIENNFKDYCVGPSNIPFSENHNIPRELNINEIKQIIKDFGDSAERAIKICKFDSIEIHAGNGCLIHQFLSKLTNHRNDEYGGEFDNRIRLLLEIIDEIKQRIDDKVPIFIKLAMCDNSQDDDHHEECWTPKEAVKLADRLIDHGVLMIDVTSGGIVNHGKSRYLLNEDKSLPAQVPLARELKKHIGDRCLIACSGGLDRDLDLLNDLVNNGEFDLALFGKGFLRDTGLTWTIADKLGVKVSKTSQYECAFY